MIRSQPFRCNFAMAFAVIFSVSAAKPITTAGRIVVFFATSASISGFSIRRSVGDSVGALFDLLTGDVLRPPIGDRRRPNERVSGQRGLDRFPHLTRRADVNDLRARGIGQPNRAGDKRNLCTGANRLLAQLHAPGVQKSGFQGTEPGQSAHKSGRK